MKIGFDAKRAFFNKTGLGNYSRLVISGLSQFFPAHEYYLYTPHSDKVTTFCHSDRLLVKGADSFFYKQFPSLWRTYGISRQLCEDGIDLFHGLSNEIPFGKKNSIPLIVTIHDIIFIHHPHLYPKVDRYIYRKKLFNAIKNASKIITVSKQTRDDLISHFSISEDKIDVVYQSCDTSFWEYTDVDKRTKVLRKYSIPEDFILNVGTIEKRKNILSVIKAMHNAKIDIPLVVIGKATPYLDEVKAFIDQYQMKNIYFLHNVPLEDLPSFYQQAKIFIYPSIFEGFGIPILEALVSRTPVITTQGGCFEEAGGSSTLYIDPENTNDIADKIKLLLQNFQLCDEMRKNGLLHAEQFKLHNITAALMNVYENAM